MKLISKEAVVMMGNCRRSCSSIILIASESCCEGRRSRAYLAALSSDVFLSGRQNYASA